MTGAEDTDGTEDTAGDPVELARRALATLVNSEPERHPLVIGLVAPLGTPLDAVTDELKSSFGRYGYETKVVRLSELLDLIEPPWWDPLPSRGEKDYYEARMNAGDALRTGTGSGAALAALAIAEIRKLRREPEAPPTAFILRSLKHSDEELLLRQVYGDAFCLLGVSSTVEERRQTLIDALSAFDDPRPEAEKLMARDESDEMEETYGQKVRSVFKQADAYLPVARGVSFTSEVDRIVDSVFGAPFLTPRAEEEAMRLAADASLRSASLGRQVGAALIPAIGTPVLTGTNEVPKPGGGQYWTTDEPDHRDFQSGNDPNPVYIKRLLEQVLERLSADEWLAEDLEGLNGEQLLERARKADMLDGTRAESLIEFTRCLHAEEAAIINAARAGVSTQGASLFTTTFPCHECTKMIVGAGIIEVQYIEPYPKSMADRLYRDLIETEPPAAAAGGLVNGKVPFRAFQGIAPRRYHIAFRAGERRSGVKAAGHDAKSNPRTSGWSEDAIATSELIAIGSLKQIMDAHSASLGMISATAEPVDDLSPAPDGEAGPDQASGTDGT